MPIFSENESIRIDSLNESNRIDSNRELECSTIEALEDENGCLKSDPLPDW